MASTHSSSSLRAGQPLSEARDKSAAHIAPTMTLIVGTEEETGMSRVSMIHHLNVQISNRERTQEWYQRVLGVEFIDRGSVSNQRPPPGSGGRLGVKKGVWISWTLPSPPVVEILGYLWFDWILVDNEHGSITVDTAEGCIAVELSNMASIVPPVGNRPETIAPFLDRGTRGVQVPPVNTADEARAAVEAVKYAPEGHRGIFSGGCPARYGFSGTMGDDAKEANGQTLVCLTLEEVEAIENLPE